MAKKIHTVRFRVPVSGELALAIERLAKRMGRPTAWLAVELLQVAVEDRQRFADWVSLAFVGKAYEVIKQVAGRRPAKMLSAPEVRLELNAPAPLVEEITRLAEQWGQTPVKAAAMLLATGVHHNGFFIEAVTSRWVRAARGLNKGEAAVGEWPPTP